MTNLITLTIPNDDHIALRAFGKALEEMALAHGAEPVEETLVRARVGEEEIEYLTRDAVAARLRVATGELQQAAPRMMQELRCEGDELQSKGEEPEIDTTVQQVESLTTPVVDREVHFDNPAPQVSDATTDSTGTPWDERIHSTSKALNADGTWRLRRKPKDMDEAEWAAFVESVKGELHTQTPVMTDEEVKALEPVEIGEPTSDEIDEWEKSKQPDYLPEPPITPPGDDFHTDVGVVTEQTVAGIPPLPVPPPVVVAPPVPEVTTWDFPRLMTFLTERHGKIDVATVNTLLAQDGMSSVQELNAHPDKIGPFVARVKAHLGE